VTRHERTARAGILFAAPAILVIVVFFFLPVIAGFGLSLTDCDIYAIASLHNLRWVGLENYARLARDPLFWTALRNTLYFVLVGGPLSVLVSLGAALLLNERWLPGRAVFRTVLFLPVVTTLVAVAVVWRYLYHPRIGPIAQILHGVGLQPIDWLGDPVWAMPAIILLAVWKNFGFNMLIFLAGLQSIPGELYEAAQLDGARAWHQFRHVTLPGLTPVLLLVGLTTFIGYLQLFGEPYVMTGGGPGNATLSLMLYTFREGFRWWNMGYAATIALVMFTLLLGIALLERRMRGQERL
jgi:multiple sugar transport system permease protein